MKVPALQISVTKNISRLPLAWMAFTGVLIMPSAWADSAVKITREPGQVHKEFLKLMADAVKQLPHAVGRLHFADDNRCKADFFVNTDTTYVVFDKDSSAYHHEFYIDHPRQSFAPILFQNVVVNDHGTGIQVLGRNGDYELMNDGEHLRVSVRKASDKVASVCEFVAKNVKVFPGETE